MTIFVDMTNAQSTPYHRKMMRRVAAHKKLVRLAYASARGCRKATRELLLHLAYVERLKNPDA